MHGGILTRDTVTDQSQLEQIGWQMVTLVKPTTDEPILMKFAWEVCHLLKSNAIVFARNEMTNAVTGIIQSDVSLCDKELIKAANHLIWQ